MKPFQKKENKNESSFKANRRKEIAFISIFLIFPIIQFIIFWVIVNYKAILMAFSNAAGTFDFGKFNFSYFVKEWTSVQQPIQTSIKNSIIFFLVSNFINLPLVILFAYYLFKKPFGHQSFRTIFFLPSIIGGVVFCTLFRFFVGVVGTQEGPVLKAVIWFYELFGKEVPELVATQGLLASEETAYFAIMIETLWTGMGMNLVLISGGLARLPQSIFDSAKMDGCNMWHEFWHIILPLLLPTINSVLTLNMAGVFMFYTPVMILTEGTAGTSTIGWYMTRFVLDRAQHGGNLNYPAFVGLLTTLVAVPFVLGFRKLIDKLTPDAKY